MKKKRRLYIKILLLFILVILISRCLYYPGWYSAEPIEARVVDKDTNKPLEGVIVVANWQLYGGYEGGYPRGSLKAMETITDENGRFSFPGWGPKIRPWGGHLSFDSPLLIFFKPDYKFKGLSNRISERQKTISLRQSDWDGKTIELENHKGDLKKYENRLRTLTISLGFIRENCNWKKVPRLLLALTKEKDRLKNMGITTNLYSVDYLPTNDDKCGSPAKFFEEFTP